MNFDSVGSPTGASAPAMTSTFSLLMKIVRDLALNRDDPEGREHHKHFVEQQFRNSDARMHRVINECGNDLTTLIQLFDLIIRRIDRSRREVSACLFSIRNCKQLLLLRRAECRRLWFQSNEQKALVKLYDQLIELKVVRQRCRQYVCLGYLVQASCLVQRSIDFLASEGKRLRQQWRENEPDEYISPVTDHKILSDAWGKSSILAHPKETSEDCLSQLQAEMAELGEDLLMSLQLALELCLFESQEGAEQDLNRRAELWSSHLVACWKEGNRESQFFSLEEDANRRSGGVLDAVSPKAVKSGSFYALPEPLSFEIDRLASAPSLHFVLDSKESSLRLIMDAATKLTHTPDAVARLLQHLMTVMPRRLDYIAVKESASVMLNSTNVDLVEKPNREGTRMCPPKCRSLAMLLSGMFDKYDHVVQSCKLLFPMAAKPRLNSGAYAADCSMCHLWSVVQRPLTAVLLAHLITDLAVEVQKMNIAVQDGDAGGADGCFNSDMILEAASKYHRIKSAETVGTDEGVVENVETSAMDDVSVDLEKFFFDANAIGPVGALAGSVAPSSYKLPSLAESPQQKKYHGVAKVATKSGQARLFRFEKSAQVQSLSEYYQDVNHQYAAVNKDTDIHFQDTDTIALGIKSVIVCAPSYRNVHAVYGKLNQICDMIDARVKDDCHDTRSDNLELQDVHLTLFKDTIFEFVKDIFVVQLRNEVRKKMSEGLPALLRPTELLPAPMQRNRTVPILFYTFLSIQAIDELLAALFDMPVHCGELWIAINEIVLQHRASSTHLFTSTLLTTPLSVEWVRDVDVNRHLRSMPSLKKLLLSSKYVHSKLSSVHTVSFDPGSSRRKSMLLTAGRAPPAGSQHSFSVKEAETILLNLTKEELNTSERMITDYRQTRLIAHQHESLTWFVNEFHRSVACKQAESGPSDVNFSNRPESESVMSSVSQTGNLAEDILLVLFVEVRVHCFYHLILLANPSNLLQYAARPASATTSCLPFRNHSVSLSNLSSSSYLLNSFDSPAEDMQSVFVSEDATIQSLVRDLFRLQESLLGALSLDKIDFLFDGLGYLIATVFIELVAKLSLLDDVGLLKMRRNILSVHSCLLNLANQRRQYRSADDEDRYSEPTGKDYATVGKTKRFHHFVSPADPDGHELLRALHFYDLLTCSNVNSLLDRIQQEFKRGQFRQQDYAALLSLKYRMDTGAANESSQHAASERPDLQSILDKLAHLFERAPVEKSASSISNLANSSI